MQLSHLQPKKLYLEQFSSPQTHGGQLNNFNTLHRNVAAVHQAWFGSALIIFCLPSFYFHQCNPQIMMHKVWLNRSAV